MSKLNIYALTPGALLELTGRSDAIQEYWFDWDLGASTGTGSRIRRLSIVTSVKYADHESWVRECADKGLMPSVITSFSDSLPNGNWPSADDWDTPVAIHCVDGRFPVECSAIVRELSSPDDEVLGQWTALCVGSRTKISRLDADNDVWRAYADGLKRWHRFAQESLPQSGTDLQSRRRRCPADGALSKADFQFWPAAPLRADELVDLFIPLRLAPWCGIGLQAGHPSTFGLLPDSTTHWSWGENLREELLELAQGASHHGEVVKSARPLSASDKGIQSGTEIQNPSGESSVKPSVAREHERAIIDDLPGGQQAVWRMFDEPLSTCDEVELEAVTSTKKPVGRYVARVLLGRLISIPKGLQNVFGGATVKFDISVSERRQSADGSVPSRSSVIRVELSNADLGRLGTVSIEMALAIGKQQDPFQRLRSGKEVVYFLKGDAHQALSTCIRFVGMGGRQEEGR